MQKYLLVVAAVCSVIAAAPCRAQTAGADNAAGLRPQELVVGTKEAPPFSMKGPDGQWIGISIDLWRHVADQLHLRYRFSEQADVQTLIDGVANGKLDVAVAAVTVTATRAQVLDFTQPFYSSGLGIAVLVGDEASWLPIIRTMTSFGFVQAVLVLVGLALVSGILVWFLSGVRMKISAVASRVD